MLTGHGDNGYLFNTEIHADFSSNVYFKGPSQGLIRHLSESMAKIGNYPEVAGENMNKKLAEKHAVHAENVLVCNGATEAFYMLALAFRNCSSTVFTPSFSEYADACNLHNHTLKFIPNTELNSNFKPDTKLVWICNPNNPDGKITEPECLLSLCKHYPEINFIIDEAYVDFTDKEISLVQYTSKLRNIIVVKSLTKKYAIPGLRIGYIVAHHSIINQLLSVKAPWSVNSLALNACDYLLRENNVSFNLEELLMLSRELQTSLSEIDGVKVINSKTSFFLIKTSHTAQKTFDYLLKKHGILVRNASNFKGVDNFCIRICSQSEEKNQLLIKALKQWMHT